MKKNMKKITALHKYIGIAVCIILIHLAVTGIFLNHTQDLDLDKHYVTSSWILDQYGLKVPQPDLVYAIQNDNFSQYGVELFFNGSPVIQIEKNLLGVVWHNGQYILATESQLLLMNQEGILQKTIDLVPFSIQKIGMHDSGLVLQDKQGRLWSATSVLTDWKETPLKSVSWSSAGSLTSINKKRIHRYFVGDGVSLEQVILDFHSGAIFKQAGKLFFDITGLLLIILSLSGLLLWSSKRKR